MAAAIWSFEAAHHTQNSAMACSGCPAVAGCSLRLLNHDMGKPYFWLGSANEPSQISVSRVLFLSMASMAKP